MSTDSPALPVLSSLNAIHVDTPCQMDWGLMTGDEKSRFCNHCSKYVYNITAMTEQEAIALVNEKEGDLCVRFYRRPDGSVVTADCPPIKSHLDSKGKRNCLQFSMAALMVLVTTSAGLCASAPWIGEKLRPIYDLWFAKKLQGNVVGEIAPTLPAVQPPMPDEGWMGGGFGGPPPPHIKR